MSDRSAVLAGGTDTGSDTLDGDPSSAIALEGDSFSAVHLSDTLSDTSVAVSDTSAGAVVVPDPLTIAVELVRNDRQVAGRGSRPQCDGTDTLGPTGLGCGGATER